MFTFLIFFIFVIIAISIHEFAHALAADRLGDPTARAAGRLTINPLAHIDPIGTVVLPLSLLLISGGAFAIGWGKPTPFNPGNLQKPRRDSAIISIAGPLSNLILATIAAIFLRFAPLDFSQFLLPLIYINVGLAVFNLMPVGPLDGQKILFGILPRDLAYEYHSVMQKYGTLILILLIFPFFGGEAPIIALIRPVINFILNILI